ncbi:hypothetical protein HY945_01945 [Candidatus Gottesmanbacteria bacterium]|nr:hypothetical protein [Candidatus Gottesmanbacteria bacterium]
MKFFAQIAAILVFAAFFSKTPAIASESITDASASLKNKVNKPKKDNRADNRAIKVRDYLTKHNSALTPYAEYIVKTADEHNIPWSLIVAIAGVESTFCKHIPGGSSNCWGWNNGVTYFKDYKEAIYIVSKTLKNNYFDKGFNTPEKIAPIYAPPSSSWGWKVRFFMNQIENHPLPNLLASTFSI